MTFHFDLREPQLICDQEGEHHSHQPDERYKIPFKWSLVANQKARNSKDNTGNKSWYGNTSECNGFLSRLIYLYEKLVNFLSFF